MAQHGLWSPDRRDMIWINCDPQAGREMRDVHPLLVLSPRAFNERTGMVIGLPMTTADFNETNPFAVKFAVQKKQTSYILGHQPKSFDWRVREAKLHPWKHVSEDVFARACETFESDHRYRGLIRGPGRNRLKRLFHDLTRSPFAFGSDPPAHRATNRPHRETSARWFVNSQTCLDCPP